MIRFQHPCGHWDEIDERHWYENGGDYEWPCPLCEEARAREREANAAFLAPVHTFLDAYGPICQQMGWSSDEPYSDYEPDEWERRWQRMAQKALTALEVLCVAAIDAGLTLRAQQLASGPHSLFEGQEQAAEPLDLEDVLQTLCSAYSRTHNSLWAGENGMAPHDAVQAFWLVDVESAERRLVEEMWRRVHALQAGPA